MIMNDDGRGPPPGLHFLKALGHAALAFGHVAFSEKRNEEDDSEEASRPRRRKLRRFTPSKPPKPAGSCCRGKR